MQRTITMLLIALATLPLVAPLYATSIEPQQYALLALGMQEAEVLAWLGPPDQSIRTPHTILVIRQRETSMRAAEKHVVVYHGRNTVPTTTLTFVDGLMVAKKAEY